MITFVNGIFNDLGLSAALNEPYFTPKILVVMLAFIFAFQVFLGLITALTDLCRK